MRKCFWLVFSAVILSFFVSCTSSKKVLAPVVKDTVQLQVEAVENKVDTFFTNLFKQQGGLMDSVLVHQKDWNVQIIYTQIDRSRNGIPMLREHHFNLDSSNYFYPASTVKLPVALLALEKLHKLNIEGLDKYSSMITEAAYSGQTAVYNDANTADGQPSIAQYIRKILLVSDNDAYNRLYEFLGSEYINDALQEKGFSSAQVLHRLNIFLSEDENRHTNPVKFFGSNDSLVYSKPLLFNEQPYLKRDDKLGKGYLSGGKQTDGPMDFSAKNRFALKDLHNVMLSLVFPQAVGAVQRFDITEEDRLFVLKYMSQFPSESIYPSYDSSYHDGYVKFILYGSEPGILPKNPRVFNKPGDAYGQLTDVAYVLDIENGVEFFVSATIYCNEDGILNDDKYDYKSIGLPFMKNLGQALYELELKRKRNFKPDLSSLTFTYDK